METNDTFDPDSFWNPRGADPDIEKFTRRLDPLSLRQVGQNIVMVTDLVTDHVSFVSNSGNIPLTNGHTPYKTSPRDGSLALFRSET